MGRRILALLHARWASAQPGSGVPIAALLLLASASGTLALLVADSLPAHAYGLFTLAGSACLVSVPLLGEFGGLLLADETGDWIEAQPTSPLELRLARLVHLAAVLAVLTLGSILPATLLPQAPLDAVGRLLLPLLALAQAWTLAAALLLLPILLGRFAPGWLVLLQTLLLGGLVVGGVAGLRWVPELAPMDHPDALPFLARLLLPPAWFAGPLADSPGLSILPSLLIPPCAIAALLWVPAPRLRGPRRGAGALLGRALHPARVLARRIWVRDDERASFELLYELLPREPDFVLRAYPLLGIPLAFLILGAQGEGRTAEGLLAILLFTPATYLPVLLNQLPGTSSPRARWMIDLGPTSPQAFHNGARKAVFVRFILPLYAVLIAFAAARGGWLQALYLGLPACLFSLAILGMIWKSYVIDPPLTLAPDEIGVRRQMFDGMLGLAMGTTLVGVVALRFLTTPTSAGIAVLALLAVEYSGDLGRRRPGATWD